MTIYRGYDIFHKSHIGLNVILPIVVVRDGTWVGNFSTTDTARSHVDALLRENDQKIEDIIWSDKKK